MRFLRKTCAGWVPRSLTHTLYTNTTADHHPQFLILHSPPSQPSKSLLVGERALAAAASWSLGSIPSVTIHRSDQSPGSHCCILTRSWSRRSLCLVLSEVRVPRIYCSGGSQTPHKRPPLGHSPLGCHCTSVTVASCFTLSLAVTDPLFSRSPLTLPARLCPRKAPTTPSFLTSNSSGLRSPSDPFPAPRHRLAKSNRLRGDARETSDRTADRKSRLPPALLSRPPPHS